MTTSEVCRYIKLNSYQIRGTYELSRYHSTSIIKKRPLGTSTLLNGTPVLMTSPHKVFHWKGHAFSQLRQFWDSGTRTKSRLQPCPRTFSLSSLPLYSPSVIVSPSGLYLRNSCPPQSCVGSASRTKLTDKDFYQT